MKPIHLSSWDDFLSALEKIKSEYEHHDLFGKYPVENRILYRGQANADDWHLETTLERFLDKRFSDKT